MNAELNQRVAEAKSLNQRQRLQLIDALRDYIDELESANALLSRLSAPAEPKAWTVLLSRPDYIADDQFDTYMTHVEAKNTMHALLKAQKEAYEHDYDEDERAEGIGAAADYRPLLVIEGKHMDVKP